MTVKHSVTVRNAYLNALEAAIGTGAILKLRTGAPPTNIADADSGSVVATLTLPSDWMADAGSGVKAKAGTWSATGGEVTGGVCGHFRVYQSNGTTQHIQGTAGETGDTPDLVLDNKTVNAGQTITMNTFSLTAGNP
jgi:hypothetical protein